MDAVLEMLHEHDPPLLWTGPGFRAQAGWFGPEERARFGWFYLPSQVHDATGVVIVPPFGPEDASAHRTLRHLAEACATAGFATLRFDLDGCGDSVGNDSEPDRVENWIGSVLDACDVVRRSGASRVVLVGIRLGAMLAALAARRRHDVAALVAFNAVVRGSGWLRELHAFQMAMDLGAPPTAAKQEGQESSGFLLSRETCESLKGIDLTRGAAPAPRVLLLERDDLPVSRSWHDRLQAEGCRVEQRRIPGYVDMMADAHINSVAQAFIDACVDHLRGLGTPVETTPAPRLPLHPSAVLASGDAWIEETVVSPGDGIFGILAKPRHREPDRALLVLNAGSVRHIGPGRFDVDFARCMAAAGMQVLRVDLTGIGDSPAREGAVENLPFGPDCVRDTAACVEWLRARGVRELTVGGICSGATHALRAAIAGQAIDAVYLINCGLFTVKPGFDHAADKRFDDIVHYSRSVKSSRSWRKLLSGNVDVRRIAKVAAWKVVLQGKSVVWDVARRVGLPMPGDLSRDFAALVRRGVKVHFLYSGNDPGLVRLAIEAGSSVPRYCRAGHFSMHMFAGANHTFTQRWAQATLLEALRQILTPVVDAPPAPAFAPPVPGRRIDAAG